MVCDHRAVQGNSYFQPKQTWAVEPVYSYFKNVYHEIIKRRETCQLKR